MVAHTHGEKTQKNKLITIVGPTASGKTGRAVDLARHLKGEVISGDSRQVYRGMDLGTGKDLKEYHEVPYHLIDICAAGEKYNLYRFVKDFRAVLSDIESRNVAPILCGGTGMYIENVLSGIVLPDVPENKELRKNLEKFNLSELEDILRRYKSLHNTTDIDTAKRAIRAIEIEEYYRKHPNLANESRRANVSQIKSLIIGIDIPREERRERITRRLYQRLEEGMVKEVETLLSNGIDAEDLIYYGLEYKFLTLYVTGKIPYSQMVKELEIAIHQFAKRQMTWFRGMEKRGFRINWLPFDMGKEEFVNEVMALQLSSSMS